MKWILVFLHVTCAILVYYKAFDDWLLPVIPDNVFGFIAWRKRVAFDIFCGTLFLVTAILWACKKTEGG